LAKINPVKLKQDAEKLEKAGRADQAILLYRQIVEDNPRDWNTVKKIGDLYVRLNRHREAIGEYAKVADFYASDGFLLKAIAMWKQINKLDASSLDPYVHLADLYAKQGLMMEAKSQYQIVVDEYVKRGKTREAGDVLRKMADIDPGDLKIRSRLADLYTRDGDQGRAVGEHIAIAEELNKKGHLAEALQVLEKGLKVDPGSLQLRLELARVHLVQKSYDRAVHYLEEAVRQAPEDPQILVRLGEAYLGARKIEEAEAISKRLRELGPDDDESRIQMGRVYLQQDRFDKAFEEFVPAIDRLVARRETDKAAALLQQIVQKSAAHTLSLAKLVEVYRAGNKDSSASSAATQLAEAHMNSAEYEDAARVLEDLIARDPQNAQHRTKLEFVKTRMGGGSGSVPRVTAAPTAPALEGSFLEEEFDLEAPEAPVPTPATARPAVRPAAPAKAAPAPPPPKAAPAPAPRRAEVDAGPLSDDDREFIEEHVAEGRVFRKYGLLDKAADQFEAVVARFPENQDARQELRDLYKEKGAPAKAAEQCRALSEIFRLRGDSAAADTYEAEARELAPAPKAAQPAPAAFRAPVHLEEEEIQLEDANEELSFDEDEEEEIPLEVEEPPVLAVQPPLQVEPEDAGLDLNDAGELPATFLDDEPQVDIDIPVEEPEASVEPPVIEPPVVEEPPLSFVESDLGLEVEMDAEQEPEPAVMAPLDDEPPLVEEPSAPAVPGEVQRFLEEVEQYMSLGFVDDARDALREIRARYPDEPAIGEAVERLGLDLDVPPEPAAFEEPAFSVEEDSSEIEIPEQIEPPPPAPADEEDVLAGLGIEPPPASSEPELVVETPEVEEEFDVEADLQAAVAEAAASEAPSEEPEVSFEEETPLVADVPVEEEEPVFAAEPEPEPEPVPEPEPAIVDVPEPAAAPAAAWDGGGFDLGAELGDLFGAQAAVDEEPAAAISAELGESGLADIFKEFKKGVDKQLGQEDYDTRYNLGIAYKEMGLIDEAIAEFQLAAKDVGRLLECSSMLGICFLDKGMPKLAIKWFEKGLKAPGRREEEYQGLRYDLATAYEAAGDLDTALGLFTELYGQDANFRDVAAKLRELRGAQA
jgi:tetratricopeptide (TPR) repeat protein